MNKKLMILASFILLIAVSPATAIETTVKTAGSDKLAAIQEGIRTTVATRIAAQGQSSQQTGKLDIQLAQLGNTISFDAILDSTPPRAYHKDLESLDEISSVIDEMLAALVIPPAALPVEQAVKPMPQPKATQSTIELSKDICSITTMGGELYLADSKAIYQLKNGKLEIWWKTTASIDEILRITGYNGSIIALIDHDDKFVTTQIKDGQVAKEWIGAVAPISNSLVKASIELKPDLSYTANRWSNSQTIEGKNIALPVGTDILATVVADVYPRNPGDETLTLTRSGKINMLDGKTSIWSSDSSFKPLPLNIEEKYYVSKGSGEVEEKIQYYYLPPRILVRGKQFIIAQNNQGLLGIFDNLKNYKNTQIISYAWTGVDMEQTIQATTSMGYCLDIAIQKDKLLSLIEMKKGRMILITSLK